MPYPDRRGLKNWSQEKDVWESLKLLLIHLHLLFLFSLKVKLAYFLSLDVLMSFIKMWKIVNKT